AARPCPPPRARSPPPRPDASGRSYPIRMRPAGRSRPFLLRALRVWRSLRAEQRAQAAEEGGGGRGRLARGRRRRAGAAPVAVAGVGRQVIAPLQVVVADDLGLAADHRLGAAIALREAAAELVHRR